MFKELDSAGVHTCLRLHQEITIHTPKEIHKDILLETSRIHPPRTREASQDCSTSEQEKNDRYKEREKEEMGTKDK